MSWRDNTNKVDCGVYLMRHLETYTGRDVARWECGFVADSKKGIRDLRMKYAHVILTSIANEKRKEILDAMKDYAKEKKTECSKKEGPKKGGKKKK